MQCIYLLVFLYCFVVYQHFLHTINKTFANVDIYIQNAENCQKSEMQKKYEDDGTFALSSCNKV